MVWTFRKALHKLRIKFWTTQIQKYICLKTLPSWIWKGIKISCNAQMSLYVMKVPFKSTDKLLKNAGMIIFLLLFLFYSLVPASHQIIFYSCMWLCGGEKTFTFNFLEKNILLWRYHTPGRIYLDNTFVDLFRQYFCCSSFLNSRL